MVLNVAATGYGIGVGKLIRRLLPIIFITNPALVIFRCNPVSHSWEIFTNGTCVSHTFVQRSAEIISALDIFLDWFYALIPIPIIARLYINKSTKISICCVLGVGALYVT